MPSCPSWMSFVSYTLVSICFVSPKRRRRKRRRMLWKSKKSFLDKKENVFVSFFLSKYPVYVHTIVKIFCDISGIFARHFRHKFTGTFMESGLFSTNTQSQQFGKMSICPPWSCILSLYWLESRCCRHLWWLPTTAWNSRRAPVSENDRTFRDPVNVTGFFF